MGMGPGPSNQPAFRLGIALIALVVLAHLAAVVGDIGRPLHVDEAEYLHTTWLMDQGRTIYRDFMQDHPPFLFQFMSLFNPRHGGGIYPDLDIEQWTTTGRIIAGACGAIVLIAAAMLAYFATRNALASLVALAYILQDPLVWQRGLADLRSDPFAMAMLWGGALLIVATLRQEARRHDALLSGTGIALVAAAALLNPKWPLESIVVGVVYLITLWRLRVRGWSQVALSLLPAALVLAASAAALLSVTTFAEYFYFTFQLKTGIQQNVLQADLYNLAASDLAWWKVLSTGDVVITLVICALVAASRRAALLRDYVDPGRTLILLALCLASIAELPFFEPYTVMWAQYRVSFTVSMGILYGIVIALCYATLWRLIAAKPAQSRNVAIVLFTLAAGFILQWILVSSLLQRASWAARTILAICAVAVWIPAILVFLHASGRRVARDGEEWLVFASAATAVAALSIVGLTSAIIGRDTNRDGWVHRAILQRTLGAEERVWLSPAFHPIASHDSSYYWYAFGDVTAGALPHAARNGSFLPPIRERDLPPCRISAGLDRETRFVELGGWLRVYPEVSRCVLSLLERGALVPTTQRTVFEVRRADAPSGAMRLPPRKAAMALRRLEMSVRQSIARNRGVASPLPSSQ